MLRHSTAGCRFFYIYLYSFNKKFFFEKSYMPMLHFMECNRYIGKRTKKMKISEDCRVHIAYRVD